MPEAAPPAVAPPAVDFGLAFTAAKMALALLLILAVILVAYWLLRRFGPKLGLGVPGRGSVLRFVAQLPLGPRKSVVVVRFLNKDLVLGVTDHHITLLTEAATDHETDADFATALDRASSRDPSP